MSIKWTLPTLIVSLCASGALQANPLDSPGIVYIDGLPCNRACQSYMAASDRALSARHREERERIVVEPVEAEVEIVERCGPPACGTTGRCRFPARRAPAWRRRTPRHRLSKSPPPPGSQANRPAMKFRQSRRSCLQKKPRLHRGGRSTRCARAGAGKAGCGRGACHDRDRGIACSGWRCAGPGAAGRGSLVAGSNAGRARQVRARQVRRGEVRGRRATTGRFRDHRATCYARDRRVACREKALHAR